MKGVLNKKDIVKAKPQKAGKGKTPDGARRAVRKPASDAHEAVIGSLIKLLKQKKVSLYEIFFSRDTGFGVEVQKGEVDALKVRSNEGVGLRVISNGSPGFGFSSVLAPDALNGLVDKALTASRHTSKDEFLSLPEPGKKAGGEKALEIFDSSIGSASEQEKIRCAMTLEDSAMAASSRVKRVRKASYSESTHFSRLVNSNGAEATHLATYFSGSVTAVAEDNGDSQMGWEIGMGHKRGAVDPEKIGKGAAGNALRMLGARTIKTVKCPAVIENAVVCELLESLASSFLADNVHKGKSMLAGRLGNPVVSKALSVWDDGTMKGGWASSVYDGEGALRHKTPLIVKGAAENYLYDTYWALRGGVKSTGNSVRSSYKGMPVLGISNIYIEKGERPLKALLKGLDRGLFITDLLGVHTINTVSGEFSLGATGVWVDSGELSYPVRGIAVSGNLLGLFSKVSAVGSDLRFIGSIGAPSILVSELEASGA